MFKSFSEVAKETVGIFEREVNNLVKEEGLYGSDTFKLILLVEVAVSAFLRNFNSEKATIENVWSMFPNYKSLYPECIDEASLELVRIYFGTNFSFTSWKNAVDDYMKLDSFLRMYQFDTEGCFSIKSLSAFPDRITHYQHLLNPETVLPDPIDYPPFLKEDNVSNVYFYTFEESSKKKNKKYLMSQDNGGKRSVPDHLVSTNCSVDEEQRRVTLPQLRKKIPKENLALELNENPWKITANELNEYIESNKHLYTGEENKRMRDWKSAANIFKLTPTNPSSQELIYKDKVNIAGIVGAGKSTFLQLELFRLKQLQAKTAVMTVNVVDTLDLVYKLHLSGLKAVPLIGKTNMGVHLKNFIKKVKRESAKGSEKNPLSQLSIQYVLQFFSGSCTAEVLADSEEGHNPPCIRLFQNDEKYSCPMFISCGKYNVERQLADADVWVGTQSAFINTKPHALVNPYDFTYAELAYEMMDVIFVDEADSVQEAVDGSFLSQNVLLGNKDAIFDNSFLSARNTLDKRYDYSSSKSSKEWRHYVNETSRVAHYLYELIQDSAYIRKEIKNNVFGHHQVLSKITKVLFNPSGQVSTHPFYIRMKNIEFANIWKIQPNREFSLEKSIREYLTGINEIKIYARNAIEQKRQEGKLTVELVELILDKFQFKQQSFLSSLDEESRKKVLLLIQFYIYLVFFDSHFKYLLKIKHQVEGILGEEISELSSVFKNVKRFLPFLPYAATGRSFQYFYRETQSGERGSVGTFRTYDYLAMGRHFLINFSTLFENITKKKGPSMVFMSGTSFAEGSTHYHIDAELDYLLETTHPNKSKIQQECYPVYDSGNPIFISGQPNERIKGKMLKKMAAELVPKIKEQLAYWGSENRKILLVVNSYEQALIVLEELKLYFPNKVKALTNDNVETDDTVLRGEVEYFGDTEADILIAPLLSINRGYNILLPGTDKSLFGSVFFLIRPYIPSGDIEYIIKALNGTVPSYIKTAKEKNHSFYHAVNYVRLRSNILLEHMLSEDENGWSYLDKEEQEMMAWYMFINVWQMIGRLLRGQTNANVFYVDAPFAWENANQSGKKETYQTSMLKIWVSILDQQSNFPEAKELLYGEFLSGLKKALKLEKLEVF